MAKQKQKKQNSSHSYAAAQDSKHGPYQFNSSYKAGYHHGYMGIKDDGARFIDSMSYDIGQGAGDHAKKKNDLKELIRPTKPRPRTFR